jgi:DNA-dependent RNA polymerase auxiliary subunit epsilon
LRRGEKKSFDVNNIRCGGDITKTFPPHISQHFDLSLLFIYKKTFAHTKTSTNKRERKDSYVCEFSVERNVRRSKIERKKADEYMKDINEAIKEKSTRWKPLSSNVAL